MTGKKKLRKYRIIKNITFWLDKLLCYGPMIAMIISCFLSKAATSTKVALSITVILSLILIVIQAINKKDMKYHSIFWLLLLGIGLCAANIITLLIVLVACTLADELIIEPIYKYYKQRVEDYLKGQAIADFN